MHNPGGKPIRSRVAHPSRKSQLQISLPGSFQLIAGRAQTHDLSLIAITQAREEAATLPEKPFSF